MNKFITFCGKQNHGPDAEATLHDSFDGVLKCPAPVLPSTIKVFVHPYPTLFSPLPTLFPFSNFQPLNNSLPAVRAGATTVWSRIVACTLYEIMLRAILLQLLCVGYTVALSRKGKTETLVNESANSAGILQLLQVI